MKTDGEPDGGGDCKCCLIPRFVLIGHATIDLDLSVSELDERQRQFEEGINLCIRIKQYRLGRMGSGRV